MCRCKHLQNIHQNNKTPHEHWLFPASMRDCFKLRQQESNLRWGSQSPLPYRLAMAHCIQHNGSLWQAARPFCQGRKSCPSSSVSAFCYQDSIPLLSRSVNRKPAQAGITAALLPFWKSPAAPLFLRPAHQKIPADFNPKSTGIASLNRFRQPCGPQLCQRK